MRQIALLRMSGHSPFRNPNVSHMPNPITVIAYIGADRLEVSRVRITFQACGVKLTVEQTAARKPIVVSMDHTEIR